MTRPAFYDRIEINPKVCSGKPVVKGTRIPVTVVLDQLAGGEDWQGILRGFPELKREDIEAVLRYAKSAVENTDIFSAAPT